jgi:hypothetical protein
LHFGSKFGSIQQLIHDLNQWFTGFSFPFGATDRLFIHALQASPKSDPCSQNQAPRSPQMQYTISGRAKYSISSLFGPC